MQVNRAIAGTSLFINVMAQCSVKIVQCLMLGDDRLYTIIICNMMISWLQIFFACTPAVHRQEMANPLLASLGMLPPTLL